MRTAGNKLLTVLRWVLPLVLAVAVVGAVSRGVLVGRETLALTDMLHTAEQQQAVLALLLPLYAQLSSEANQVLDAEPLLYPGRQALDTELLPEWSERFQNMATMHGFRTKDIDFQVHTEDQVRFLQVTLPMVGRYQQFGPFLADVIRLPSLLSVDHLSVVWGDDADRIDITFRLAVE